MRSWTTSTSTGRIRSRHRWFLSNDDAARLVILNLAVRRLISCTLIPLNDTSSLNFRFPRKHLTGNISTLCNSLTINMSWQKGGIFAPTLCVLRWLRAAPVLAFSWLVNSEFYPVSLVPSVVPIPPKTGNWNCGRNSGNHEKSSWLPGSHKARPDVCNVLRERRRPEIRLLFTGYAGTG